MSLFGKQVSLAVLLSFVTGLITSVTGIVTLALNNWGKGDPSSFILLISGAVVTAVTAAVHTWDTQPLVAPSGSIVVSGATASTKGTPIVTGGTVGTGATAPTPQP